MKSEDRVSFNCRLSVYCGMLIRWLGGGQQQRNSFPRDTSDLVSVCYCSWRQRGVSVGSACGLRGGCSAFAGTLLLAGRCRVLSSAHPRRRLRGERAQPIPPPQEALSPLHLKVAGKKMDGLGSVSPTRACLGSSVCIWCSTPCYGAHCRSALRWSARPPVSHLASDQGKLLQEAPGLKCKGRGVCKQQPSFIWTSHAPSSPPPQKCLCCSSARLP